MGPRPPRSTKAGAETPATRNGFAATWSGDDNAQRRPGPRPRRHPPGPGCVRCGCSTLNEGRGRDPGDTGGTTRQTGGAAQRRPGPRPRRHSLTVCRTRSTCSAQRRPGPRPRRHARTPAPTPPGSYAQRRPGPRPRRHEKSRRVHGDGRGRSTKAGAETPATRFIPPSESTGSRSLNEGRGRDPGDTPPAADEVLGPLRRSTKAGAETPATR